jgi:DNA (cytosine-5)-methyltransferase 1
MKAVSLFAGVGGFDLALSRSGVEVVAAVDIDKHARKVLAKQFPDTEILEDVCNVTGNQLTELGFNSDGIIVGGFPCQDLSVAGKRAGLEGARSGLFWEIHRLLKETKAKWFILENVPGLLSSNGGRDMGTVLGSLAELGYGVAYRVLDAQYFGVAQRRRRVFIVGRLGDSGRTPAQILDLLESSAGDNQQSEQKGQDSSTSTNGSSLARQRDFGDYELDQVAGVLKARDYKDATDLVISNSVAYSFDSLASNSMKSANPVSGCREVFLSKTIDTAALNPSANQGGIAIVQPFVKVIRSGARAEDGSLPAEVWAERDVSPTLNVMDNTGESRATVVTVFHPHYHDGARVQGETMNTLTSRMGTGGNNVSMVASTYPIQGTIIGRADTSGPQGKGYGELNDPMFTLDRVSGHGVSTGSTVRRLTPIECERLQGFPDNWTEGQADSHRYKQMGNAVAVPVVEWIISRLLEQK